MVPAGRPRPRSTLAHPRAGWILVLAADAEAITPAPRPDPGTLRPRGRARLSAHWSRPVRPSRRGRRGARRFSVAALSPALDRRRYRMGAAARPATALAPRRRAP